ncbi:hypothetical protein ONS95_002203 [Cadophora gregata]|uniref:uncharacterized protein n=1 Tax=Cadophora gregata TaxID=51156 RepID=UPI0026DD5E9E|nr:uncharacterized protein ONS95_002203 [Cadophora gregata]KAK0109514.1 hypothetical protein ONS95_002203 [Cadophora gregata]KAK0110859.1 hypothetical protein ONS96_002448 [Cadophora gregata f. sp. sojae]
MMDHGIPSIALVALERLENPSGSDTVEPSTDSPPSPSGIEGAIEELQAIPTEEREQRAWKHIEFEARRGGDADDEAYIAFDSGDEEDLELLDFNDDDEEMEEEMPADQTMAHDQEPTLATTTQPMSVTTEFQNTSYLSQSPEYIEPMPQHIQQQLELYNFLLNDLEDVRESSDLVEIIAVGDLVDRVGDELARIGVFCESKSIGAYPAAFSGFS